MRLFLAINFEESIKNELMNTITKMKKHTKQGKFTFRENLHLTLVFIGETTKVSAIRQAMDALNANSFTLSVRGIGKFRRDGGDIYWFGIDKNQQLVELQKQLSRQLSNMGFMLESREYKPHLTLGREIILDEDFDELEFSKTIVPISMNVLKISLMKSERINGKLTYTEIYTKQLGDTLL